MSTLVPWQLEDVDPLHGANALPFRLRRTLSDQVTVDMQALEKCQLAEVLRQKEGKLDSEGT